MGRLLWAVAEESPSRWRAAVALAEYLVEWTADEMDVLGHIAERLNLGRARYGPLDLGADPRDWDQEAVEELEDATIYAEFNRIVRLAQWRPRGDREEGE
jgi:hypothetical protein